VVILGHAKAPRAFAIDVSRASILNHNADMREW
jgi:hypothetical protein